MIANASTAHKTSVKAEYTECHLAGVVGDAKGGLRVAGGGEAGAPCQLLPHCVRQALSHMITMPLLSLSEWAYQLSTDSIRIQSR